MAAVWTLVSAFSIIFIQSPTVSANCNAGCDARLSNSHSEISYQESNAGLVNPERGGAILLISKASGLVPLTEATLAGYRTTEYINLIWRLWYLDTFLTTDISESFLTHIDDDLNLVREVGFKAIIRFAYTDVKLDPVTEPTKELILTHIEQLKPLLQKHTDVILTVQLGFIGVWGEWYYSTNFGNVSIVTDQELEDRKDVVNALVDAIPCARSFQIRTPELKRSITRKSSALTSSDYRSSSNNASRIGHHNDCFLASSTDFGTYGDVTVDYPYLAQDTKYVPMGGETCVVNINRTNCTTAMEELEMFHWTYLNLVHNLEVVDGWKEEGCYEEIFNKLGYKLRLVTAVLPDTVERGSDACFEINFINEGYAAPVNPREVRLVLRSSTESYRSNHIERFTKAEPWLPESGVISVSFSLSMDVPAGDYEVLLELGDPLLSHPDYSILLANSGVPETSVGLNNLHHIIAISAPSSCIVRTRPGFTLRSSSTSSDNLRCYANCEGVD